MTNVRWTSDDGRLISVGGADTSVMVWSHARAHESEDTGGDSDDSDTDSEEEGGYDSDVEKEKNLTYEDKIYANPIRTTKGVKPHLRERQEDEEHRYIFIVNLGWGGAGGGYGYYEPSETFLLGIILASIVWRGWSISNSPRWRVL